MRKSVRDAISDLHSALALRIEATERVLLQRIHEADEGAITAIDKIQPASVDLTQEMADDIVRKIHGPLTISKEFSDSLRNLAQYKDWFQMLPFGYGGDSGGVIELTVKTNGTLWLRIVDPMGQPRWTGTFVPPDFGVQS